jgi:hypothetical protein
MCRALIYVVTVETPVQVSEHYSFTTNQGEIPMAIFTHGHNRAFLIVAATCLLLPLTGCGNKSATDMTSSSLIATSPGALTEGQYCEVEYKVLSDGTLYAEKIEIENKTHDRDKDDDDAIAADSGTTQADSGVSESVENEAVEDSGTAQENEENSGTNGDAGNEVVEDGGAEQADNGAVADAGNSKKMEIRGTIGNLGTRSFTVAGKTVTFDDKTIVVIEKGRGHHKRGHKGHHGHKH